MTITIIGGSGFVGTRLTKRLLTAGHTVRIADKRRCVAYPELWMRCDVRNGLEGTDEFPESVTDADTAPGADRAARESQPMHSLLEVLSGSDAVVNLAAEHRDDVNVRGSQNVCETCARLGIRKIVFTSSVAVYGFAPVGTDEGGEINYFNDYGRTKFLAEKQYREWLKTDSANSVVIIRPTVIFGEGNRGNVYNLLRQIAGGKFPMVGRGTNRKSMNYVENVAAFIQFCIENGEKLPCLEKEYDGTASGKLHLFNYCDEPAYDMNGLVLDVYRHLGKPRERLVHFPYWLAYCGGKCFDLFALVLRRKFAVSAIRVKKFCQDTYFVGTNIKKTGFVPPVSLEDGLRATIEYEFIHKVQGHTFCCE